MTKKVLVTLTDEQLKKLESMGDLGGTNSERLRNAFLVYDQTRTLTEVLRMTLTQNRSD